MATPLARRPALSSQNLAVALELLRGSGATSDELAALSAAGVRVELAWASSTRPEWMIRLAWLLGADRRLLVLALFEALTEATRSLSIPPALARLLEDLPAWAKGEIELDALLAGLDDLAGLVDLEEAEAEPDLRDPSILTLLCWAGQVAAWAADAAEHTDLLRWRLGRLSGEAGHGRSNLLFLEPEATLPELMREGASHAAAALRFCCDASGVVGGLGAARVRAGRSGRSQAGDPVPWTPRAIAARRAADALREILPAGTLMQRLTDARFAPSANWID